MNSARKRAGSARGGHCHGALVRSYVLLAGLALAWACGDDGSTAPATPAPASIVVSPVEVRLDAPGSTAQLTAQVLDRNDQRMTEAAVTWTSNDADVAIVSSTGLVTVLGNGQATITATAGGASGTVAVTVARQATGSAATDRAALVALYEATDGPNWVDNTNWLTDARLDDWYGVDTDASGRVVRLELDDNALSGTVPAELGSLPELKRLDLPDNRLTGPIPVDLGNLTNLTNLELDDNELTGPIPPELGKLTKLTNLELDDNGLSGPIPAELGGLDNLAWLELNGNDLSGPLPSELGNLSSLRAMLLWRNELSGSIPESFLVLRALERFDFTRNAELCAPGTTGFVAWLGGIEAAKGPYCNESDMSVLERLYETAAGTDWTNSGGWLDTPALEEWHGVTADSLGRVETLNLTRNGLAGRLASNLGNLAAMTRLRIGENSLSGRLPRTLSRLSLVELHYTDTELCAPSDAPFQSWLAGIASHEGTGEECPPLTDREILEILYEATDGPNWIDNTNWLTDEHLGDWYGVETDASDRVVRLELDDNALIGPIPFEFGDLVRLERLNLEDNALTGSIPSSFLQLAGLDRFYIARNESLCVPGIRAFATWLNGIRYRDTAPISCNADDVFELTLLFELAGGSDWTRSDGWLGDFVVEEWHGVRADSLGRVLALDLGHNELSGRLPSTLGTLSQMITLRIDGNPGLSGRLPNSLTDLSLRTLHYRGTGLCTPADDSFGAWLMHIPSHEGTGVECSPPSDREIVDAVYEAAKRCMLRRAS